MNNIKLWKKIETCNLKKNDGLPVWCFEVENIIVENQRYLKIWLINRLLDSRAINRVIFNYEGKEYTASEFKISSAYKNENVVGCVLPIEIEQTSKDIEITKEIVGGETYLASKKNIDYTYTEAPNVDFEYIKRKKGISGDMYPHLDKTFWQCTCGAINNKGKTCHCGNNEGDMIDVINYDVKSSKLADYLMNDIKYDISKSFENNIDDYCGEFEVASGFEADCVKERLDLIKEKEKYYDLVEKDRIRKEEEAQKAAANKKKLTIIGIVAGCLAVAGIVIYIVFGASIKYSGCKAKSTAYERMECYASVPGTKEADQKKVEEFNAYLQELLNSNAHEAVVTAFENNAANFKDCYSVDSEGQVVNFSNEDLKKVYVDAIYNLIKKSGSSDVETALANKEKLSKLTDEYDDELNEMIYKAYEQVVSNGKIETVEYFAEQYQSGIHAGEGYGRVNLEKAMHAYLSDYYSDNGVISDSLVYEISNAEFGSLREFYNSLKKGGYSKNMMNDKCYRSVR